jgi:Flp pilus assembly protein TadD
LTNLGAALGEQGRSEEAISCFRKALEYAPNHAAAYGNLGQVLLQRGQTIPRVARPEGFSKVK